MSKAHVWGERDTMDQRCCNRVGCTVRVRRAFGEWQGAPRMHWVPTHVALIPDCTGGKVPTVEGK